MDRGDGAGFVYALWIFGIVLVARNDCSRPWVELFQSNRESCHPESPGAIFVDQLHKVRSHSSRILVIVPVASEVACLPIETVQSPAGSDPQRAVDILIDGIDPVAAQTLGIVGIVPVLDELVFLTVISIQTAQIGSSPECASWVFIEGPDKVAACALGIRGVRQVIVGKATGLAIVSIQAATVFPDPEHTFPILVDRPDGSLTQAVRIIRVVSIHHEFVAIVAVETVLCAEPHEPQMVLQNAQDRVLGEPIFP